ncbi:MAG: T9SS type A sorting domain-containing protein, partial [Bacteroidales bacterium]|nr:T9SS type A sorting domain-containing protein [Bacteroidales bacterium]
DAGNTSEFSNWHDSQVAVNEPKIARFRVWPNPTSDLLHLEIFEENILQNAEIQLFDVNGRKMLAQPLSASSILDISTIAPGLYFIQIIDNQNIIGVGKFIRN